MHRLQRGSSSSATPINSPPSIPTPTPQIEFIKKELGTHSKAKNPMALVASSSSIALSIGSPSCNPSDTGSDEASKESCWRTAYVATRMAVEVAKESLGMFFPLKAVVGALAVLIKNYDQIAANAEQMKEIEG